MHSWRKTGLTTRQLCEALDNFVILASPFEEVGFPFQALACGPLPKDMNEFQTYLDLVYIFLIFYLYLGEERL